MYGMHFHGAKPQQTPQFFEWHSNVMNTGFSINPYFHVPIYPPGKEPLPPGWTEDDRLAWQQSRKWEQYMTMGMESCVSKTLIAGGGGRSPLIFFKISFNSLTLIFFAFCPAGFGLGAFFSLMSASFAYEDPYLRQQTQAGLNVGQKAREVFKDMGKGMWKSGKSFGRVGALFSGIECVIESVSVVFYSIIPSPHPPSLGGSTAPKTISSMPSLPVLSQAVS